MDILVIFLILVISPNFSNMELFNLEPKSYIYVDSDCHQSHLRKHFWHYSGLSPPSHEPDVVRNYLLSQDMKKNFAYISGLPTGSIKYERIHWLFSLINYEPKENSFDFTLLDELLDWMKNLDLIPIFELMGTPLNLKPFLMSNKPWRNLCYNTVKHCSERYGFDYIRRWKFETWNEIDSKQYNVIGFTIEEYLNYINECFTGINEFSKSVVTMGPAGVLKRWTNYSASFLKFCYEKQDMCNLTLITFHQKGYPKNVSIGANQYRTKLNRLFPKFKNLKMANDEADTMTGWWIPTSWRADVRYAAKMSRLVYLWFKSINQVDFSFLSFDNSFLNKLPSTFEQRTLLARFTIDAMTNHSQFFEKPSYSVMGMMNILGDYLSLAEEHPIHKEVTYLVTSNHKTSPNRITGIVIRTNDFDMNEDNKTVNFSIKFNLPHSWIEARYEIFMISNSLPHPAKVFDYLKNPPFPTAHQRMMIRNAQGPHLISRGVAKNEVYVSVNLPNPSVTLINICSSTVQTPSQLTNVQAVNITFNEVLIIWKDNNAERCIKTYIVEFQKEGSDVFVRINDRDTFFCHFHFAIGTDYKIKYNSLLPTQELIRGRYRVSSVDYWDRRGISSEELIYGTRIVPS